MPPPQLPAPSHVDWDVCVPLLHDAATQTVPAAHRRHAPVPSQEPSLPHVDCACVAHSLSGSAPFAMAPHVPSAPAPFFAAVHATQTPPQPVSQQTPSTQLPLVHSIAPPHAAPLAFVATQALLLQYALAAQSACEAQ